MCCSLLHKHMNKAPWGERMSCIAIEENCYSGRTFGGHGTNRQVATQRRRWLTHCQQTVFTSALLGFLTSKPSCFFHICQNVSYLSYMDKVNFYIEEVQCSSQGYDASHSQNSVCSILLVLPPILLSNWWWWLKIFLLYYQLFDDTQIT